MNPWPWSRVCFFMPLRIFAAMFKLNSHPDDTIAAPATAAGVGAIGLIRVSGSQAFEITQKVFKGKTLAQQLPNTIHYGHVMDKEQVVDEVMVAVFKAPRSFTAENSVEITCHGSLYIQNRIMELLLSAGARLAEPGEFTVRAYLNGRIDLAQAEAVGDIIAAKNASQLDMAMNQMRGGLSRHLKDLREQLLNFVSLVELELDFGEEDVEFADRSGLRSQLTGMQAYIRPMISSFKLGNAIRQGIPVAIAGRPNAGKSSLLNALLNDDRAIVSDIAGTTRDTIEEEINIQGVAFRFIDTAGIRETEDVIEKIGIEKAFKSIGRASLVIHIFDASGGDLEAIKSDYQQIRSHNPEAAMLLLANKTDLASAETLQQLTALFATESQRCIMVSLKDQSHHATEEIREALYERMNLGAISAQQTVISNQRHHQCLKEADEAISQALQLMDAGSGSDLLALEMRRAVTAIGDITGTITNDEVLGNIFGKFCIGK